MNTHFVGSAVQWTSTVAQRFPHFHYKGRGSCLLWSFETDFCFSAYRTGLCVSAKGRKLLLSGKLCQLCQLCRQKKWRAENRSPFSHHLHLSTLIYDNRSRPKKHSFSVQVPGRSSKIRGRSNCFHCGMQIPSRLRPDLRRNLPLPVSSGNSHKLLRRERLSDG